MRVYFCRRFQYNISANKKLIVMKKAFILLLMAIAYLATFILGAASGAIHPACYAYAGAVLPLLTALVYLYTSTLIRGFGAATLLNGFILVLFLIADEADLAFAIGIMLLTALAEFIRWRCGYGTQKKVYAGVSCPSPTRSSPTRPTGGPTPGVRLKRPTRRCP